MMGIDFSQLSFDPHAEEEDVVPESYVRAARHFAMIPVGALTAEISPSALKVYAVLRTYVRPGKATFPYVKTACKTFGISESMFRRGLSELSDAGLIVIGKRQSRGGFRRSNEYFFPDLDDGLTDPDMSDMTGVDMSQTTDVDMSHTTRPKEVEKKEVEKIKEKRAHVIPAEFELSASMRNYYCSKMPLGNAELEFEAFLNWHLSKGTKAVNWEASWRTWVLKAVQFTKAGPEPVAIWDLDTARDPYAGMEGM